MAEDYSEKIKVHYQELTPSEFLERLADAPVAYLPLGTLEFHGDHLPLGSDGIQPLSFFSEVAAEIGGIVLPALFLGPDRMEEVNGTEFYGKDLGNPSYAVKQQYEKQILPGSAYWIPDSLFIAIIESILNQLKRQGFKILVAHGHGPSTNLIIKNRERWEPEFGIKLFHLWGSGNDPEIGFMSDHAGMLETSVVMKYRPGLVHMENLPEDISIWPRGIRGFDPRIYASKEKGDEIVRIQKQRIIKIIREELGR
jgi:creatinine amidohydrolase